MELRVLLVMLKIKQTDLTRVAADQGINLPISTVHNVVLHRQRVGEELGKNIRQVLKTLGVTKKEIDKIDELRPVTLGAKRSGKIPLKCPHCHAAIGAGHGQG